MAKALFVFEGSADAASGPLSFLAARRLIRSGLRQGRIEVPDPPLQSLYETRWVDVPPFAGRPPNLGANVGDGQRYLVEATVDHRVDIEAGKVSDRGALTTARRTVDQRRYESMEMIASVYPFAMGIGPDRDTNAIAAQRAKAAATATANTRMTSSIAR